MSCDVEIRKGTIHVRGEMTIYAAAMLKQDLFAAVAGQTQRCRIDLSAVSELDATGLQLLLMAKRVCAARKVQLAMIDPSVAVREVIDLLCISDLCADPVGAGQMT